MESAPLLWHLSLQGTPSSLPSDPYTTARRRVLHADHCADCEMGVTFNPQAGATACVPVLPACPPGQEEAGVPTLSTDRTCRPCVLGDTFKAETSNAPCAATTACGFNEGQTQAPTLSADRVCSPLPSGAPSLPPSSDPSPTATVDPTVPLPSKRGASGGVWAGVVIGVVILGLAAAMIVRQVRMNRGRAAIAYTPVANIEQGVSVAHLMARGFAATRLPCPRQPRRLLRLLTQLSFRAQDELAAGSSGDEAMLEPELEPIGELDDSRLAVGGQDEEMLGDF